MSSSTSLKQNIDPDVVNDFGHEWAAFNQSTLTGDALTAAFNEYFHIFPFASLPEKAEGFDMGCGSGRWAKMVAPRVGRLNCIDPSDLALAQARKNLADRTNVTFECAGVDQTALPDASQDFGYCLGVLHHIPDTAAGLRDCTRKLKPGAPFLLYLYYRFDNRPAWFRAVWKATDYIRRFISHLPFRPKWLASQIIAFTVYWPLARLSWVLEKCGVNVRNIPLSAYRDKTFYFMRTDALDRFGTKLEQRFTQAEIRQMMESAGLKNITFSTRTPHWVAVGYKM
jgi:SAM-dependent methyltransferase